MTPIQCRAQKSNYNKNKRYALFLKFIFEIELYMFRTGFSVHHQEPSTVYTAIDGFGGLVVSMLAAGSRVRGFDPDRSRWIFSDVKKILSMPSFGGEVK
jgi:hypothetical protein